ncbi:hypothetical protein Tco_0343790 [Tanacetum coccineum]
MSFYTVLSDTTFINFVPHLRCPRHISARRKLYSGNISRECIKFPTLAMIMAEEDTHYAHRGFLNVGLIYLSARRKNALSTKIKRIKDVVKFSSKTQLHFLEATAHGGYSGFFWELKQKNKEELHEDLTHYELLQQVSVIVPGINASHVTTEIHESSDHDAITSPELKPVHANYPLARNVGEPKMADKKIANIVALFISSPMMLRYLQLPDYEDHLECSGKYHTKDLGGSTTTKEATDGVESAPVTQSIFTCMIVFSL